jgi:glycosyltransferase involved in cell wall biosynthesis
MLDGIHVERGGRQWTVHQRAFTRYHLRHREFDVVVDEVNTIPFFTPLWTHIPRVMLIHQLAREVWWHESRFPLSLLGYAAEPLYLRLYRHTPTLTVSDSTRRDLLDLGLTSPITIVPEGLEALAERLPAKGSLPTVIYVGRIAPSKRVTDIVRGFASFQARWGKPARLWLVGEGRPDYVRRVRSLAQDLGVGQAVEFCGWLSREDKHKRMAEAHALVMTSVREGWGLAVSEANACGTPAIVYDVPGLRDSVHNEETGLVVAPSPSHLSDGLIRLMGDPALRERLASNARAFAQSLSFDDAARIARQGMIQAINDWHSRGHTGSVFKALLGRR